MSSRDAVRMTGDEMEAFLREQRKVQVGTVGKDGAPHLTTLFHVVRDGRIAFWTYGSSQKVRNLERDPRITCLVEAGEDYFELRGVSVQGTAELVREYDEVLDLGTAVAVRMFGLQGAEQLGEQGLEIVRQQARKRVGILVTPGKVASWDHAKLT